MSKPNEQPREPESPHPSIMHRGKDLRIPNTTPEKLAKTLLRGGAQPRLETRRRQMS